MVKNWLRSSWLGLLLLVGAAPLHAELNTRFKYSAAITELPSSDIRKNVLENWFVDHQLDARFQLSDQSGFFSWNIDVTASALKSGSIELERFFGTADEQRRGSQAKFRVDLARRIHDQDDQVAIVGVDRAVIQYRRGDWSLKLGRDALSWGNGLVFHPLDLFSPYSPTAVDREFKTASDMILFEKLFLNGADLQVLHIARKRRGDQDNRVSTSAMKFSGLTGSVQYEVILGQHYEDKIVAGSLQLPVGGALLRTDVLRACVSKDCFNSMLANLDYTFSFRGGALYTFAEFFHNGFGVTDDLDSVVEYPQQLLERASRGELFNLMQDYMAMGVVFPWHPLWSQPVSLITNLQDRSTLLQTFLTYDPTDDTRLQFGVLVPVADQGTEFGKRSAGMDQTVGGGWSIFLNMSYYL